MKFIAICTSKVRLPLGWEMEFTGAKGSVKLSAIEEADQGEFDIGSTYPVSVKAPHEVGIDFDLQTVVKACLASLVEIVGDVVAQAALPARPFEELAVIWLKR